MLTHQRFISLCPSPPRLRLPDVSCPHQAAAAAVKRVCTWPRERARALGM